MQMPFMATALLKQNNLQQSVDMHKFLQFITQIYNRYDRKVQYHNDLHGSDVAQHLNVLLNQGFLKKAQLNDADTLSLLVAALCHDVGHDGFNNRYHVITESHLYQCYGDQGILESMHAAQTLKLLNDNEYDFLSAKFTGPEC